MRRRKFIALLSGVVAWALQGQAESAVRMRRIGVLSGFPEGDAVGESLLAAFRQRLTSLGWIDGNNIGVEVRWAEADAELMRAHAVELTQMMPDAIVVHGSKALTAVRRGTDRIPIVFVWMADPIGLGYVGRLGIRVG